MRKTTEVAHGRWPEIFQVLGIKLKKKRDMPCPVCGGTDRFWFSDYRGNGDYYCRKCGNGDGIDLICKVKGCDHRTAFRMVDDIIRTPAPKKVNPKPAPKPDHRQARAGLWTAAYPLSGGDPVSAYLRSRKLTSGRPTLFAIRYVERMRHEPSKSYHPGMIALVSSPDDDRAKNTIHRTYLTGTGAKADVEPNKMLMPGPFPEGGAIRLEPPCEHMGVAEGIETALAAAIIFNIPVWSTVAEGYLRKWQPPVGVKRITIFGDNDANFVGQAAAYHLAAKLSQGYQIDVAIPDISGYDYADVLRDQSC